MINRIDTALEAEEFKHMQNMLEPLPLNMVNEHHMGMNQAKYMQTRERVAYTKIDQYNSNPGTGGAGGPYHVMGGYGGGANANNGSQSSKMKHQN